MTMARRIAIIQGRADPAGDRFYLALADAHRAGAEGTGRELKRIEVAKLDLLVLRGPTG
jgi:hypothetical protein